MLSKISISIITLFFMTNLAVAEVISEKKVPETKRTKAALYLNAKDAYEVMKKEGDKTLFIDVRTRGEVAYVGMPTMADANVPFKFTNKKYQWNDKKNNFKMVPNPGFVAAVTERVQQKGLTKNDKVLVMCRSGGRSAKAADALTQAGFSQVYSVIDGFEGDGVKTGERKGKRMVNGWKNSGLPWSFDLDKNKMYFAQKDAGDKENKMLKKMDTDQDNSVTQIEFDIFHKKMFAKMDQNKNGMVDSEELVGFKKQQKQEKKKQKQEKHIK